MTDFTFHSTESAPEAAMKTLSNQANHVLDTPVDVSFRSESWPPVGAANRGN